MSLVVEEQDYTLLFISKANGMKLWHVMLISPIMATWTKGSYVS